MEPGRRFRVDVLTEKATAAGDLTHYAIAQRAGVRESTISRLLAGQTIPSLPTLIAVADAYGCALDDLVDRTRGNRTQPASKLPRQRATRSRASVPT